MSKGYRTFTVFLIFFVLLAGCESRFQQFGEFTVRYLSDGCKDITDGIGRRFILVPRGTVPPKEYREVTRIQIPVRRVVVFTAYDASLISLLGHIDSIAGIVTGMRKWSSPEINRRIRDGRIALLGDCTAVDFERLSKLRPDVVFTWKEDTIPELEELSIPCIITSTRIAMGVESRINLVRFIASFYNEEEKADRFAREQFKRLKSLELKVATVHRKLGVIWGDIHARKVLIEPGNSWAGQLVELAGGNYLFKDLEGASCMQVTLEKFFYRARKADILITYRGPGAGITSKQKLVQSSRLLQIVNIKPVSNGKIYFTGACVYESPDTAAIAEELAAILHPKLFSRRRRRFFFELPGV